jgi:uncharacterized SAM-binding protein YcdF (DUF218 family)
MKSFWLIADNPPIRPDCFVIPSYALKNRTTPTLPTRSEIDLAAAWWTRFPEAVVIVSTGDNQSLGVTNAAVMAEYAAGQGIGRDRIIQEDRSLNTFENLTNCLAIVQSAGYSEPTLVTLDLYTRRAVAVAHRIGWSGVRWLSAYSRGEPAAGYKYYQTYSRMTIRCYEMAAMAYCKIAGWA